MRAWALLVTLGWLCSADVARAWTVAEVVGAMADVTIDSTDEAAVVRLQGDVVVRGGWLTRLELQLVSDDEALVREPRLFVLTEDDETNKPPRIVRAVPLEHRFRKDGALLLEFDRKDAPKKGRYRFEVLYRVRGIVRDAGQGAELRWSFPPWQNGLDDVEMRVHIHERYGVTARDVTALAELDKPTVHHERDGYVSLHWMRPHLPRTLSWEVGVHLAGVDAPLQLEPARDELVEEPLEFSPPSAITSPRKPNVHPAHWWTVVAVLGACLLLSFRGPTRLRALPAKQTPDAGLLGGANIAGLRQLSIYHLRIGSSSGTRLVPYLHLTFEPHSAAAVALRRTFASVAAEDRELTLAYREGLVEELIDMFERFSAAHRKIAQKPEVHALAA